MHAQVCSRVCACLHLHGQIPGLKAPLQESGDVASKGQKSDAAECKDINAAVKSNDTSDLAVDGPKPETAPAEFQIATAVMQIQVLMCVHACVHVCMHSCVHACVYACFGSCKHACLRRNRSIASTSASVRSRRIMSMQVRASVYGHG